METTPGCAPRARISTETPTWSWASLHAQVKFIEFDSREEETVEEKARVLDAGTVLASGDPMGPVKGGWVKILAPVNIISVTSDGVFLGGRRLEEDVMEVKLDGITELTGEFYLLSLCRRNVVDYSADRENGDINSYSIYLVLRPEGREGYYQRCELAVAEHFHIPENRREENGEGVGCVEFRGRKEGHVVYLV